MFSGIGGFELGLARSRLDHQLVGFSEVDKFAISIYEEKFEGVKNYGDATNIRGDELPDFGLLVAGFPCQSFSVAGKGRGFDETRGTLFFEIARICAEKKPRYVLLENVAGLLSNDGGKTFQTILGVLADLGYGVEWQVLNSKNFGVPQNRDRVFIVGHLGNRSKHQIFPLTESSGISHVRPPKIASALQHPGHSGENYRGMTLIQTDQKVPAIPVSGVIREQKSQNGRRFKDDGDPSFTLTGQDVHGVLLSDNRIRRLTPTECERLQGFPDGWTKGQSATQRYKTLGNAVTVNVVEAVINQIADSMISKLAD